MHNEKHTTNERKTISKLCIKYLDDNKAIRYTWSNPTSEREKYPMWKVKNVINTRFVECVAAKKASL